jgi:dipeptidyl aminopeptidase/acylaminoacyl peptidase
MAQALYRSKHPFRFVMLEGGEHGLTEHAAEVDRLILNWFAGYLRDGRKWPSLEPHGQ